MILIFLLVSFVYFWVEVRPRFGAIPHGEHLKAMGSSPNYNQKQKRFVNIQEALVAQADKDANVLKITWEFLFPKNQVIPKKKLTEVKPDLSGLMSASNGIQFIWLGHSSFLLRVNGKLILVDPVFSKSAAPLDFLTPRFQPPVIGLKELPNIDVIVISHDHYDHLDSKTIKFFEGSEVEFFVPLGVSAHLERWGILKSKITELDWWEHAKWGGLEFICTPAQHFSGRTKPYENKTLWASWIIKSEYQKIYYSGDSGYGPHFKEIGDRYGPFDASFIENGQYDDQWRPVHMHPSETIKAYIDLKSKALVPVHWGMFNMAMHHWYDPIETLESFASKQGINLLTPKIGQLIDLENPKEIVSWWKNLLPKSMAQTEVEAENLG